MFLHCPVVKIQYGGETPWPRGGVLDLRQPGLEFQMLCHLTKKSQFLDLTNQHHREVLLTRFSLYVHKGGVKLHTFIDSLIQWFIHSCSQYWQLLTGVLLMGRWMQEAAELSGSIILPGDVLDQSHNRILVSQHGITTWQTTGVCTTPQRQTAVTADLKSKQ